MGLFLSYSLVSGMLLLAMYLIYRTLLAGENQHAYNRAILLSIYAVSFTALPASSLLGELFAPSHVTVAIQPSAFSVVSTQSVVPEKPVWGTVLIWIFMAGMIVVGLRTIATWMKLVKVIASGRKECRDGYTIVVIDDCRIAPFSWMRYMVINRNDFSCCPDAIITHELNHIRRYHWIDLLIAQVVVIVNWFNPAAWLMREELMLIHEYQSDMAVISGGHDPRQYQMLLIKKAVGARFPSLANSLNHSKLKKRITMMYQEKSGKGRRLKALALVPPCALALSLTSIPAVEAAITSIGESSVSTDKVSEKTSLSQTLLQIDTIRVVGYGVVGKAAGDGTKDQSSSFPDKKVIRIDHDNEGVSGATKHNDYRYILDGKEISESQLNQLDRDEIASITVDKAGDEIMISTRKGASATPDVIPVYKNGLEDLYRELALNVSYPEAAAEKGIEGKAVVEFILTANATITGTRIVKSSGNEDLDAEAIRAVKTLEYGWTPGMTDGKPVNCTLALPVDFRLHKPANK